MTPGRTHCIHLPARRLLDKVQEEMGELAFGNILLGGPIMSLATAAEGLALNGLSVRGSGGTGATLGKVDWKHSRVPISTV